MSNEIEERLARLRAEDAATRRAAAQELGRCGNVQASGPLSEALDDPDPAVRGAAASALHSLGTPALAELTARLNAPEAPVRLAAVRGLSVLGRDAAAILAELLDCPEPDTRLALSEPLGQPNGPDAVERLLETLAEDEEDPRHAAWLALSRIGEGRLAEAVRTALRGDPEPLVHLRDPRALSALRHALTSSYVFVRRAAVKALGQVGGSDSVEPLLTALEDPEPDVRHAAIETLGYLGDPRATDALVKVLDGKTERLRPAAAEALGRIRDPRAVVALVRALGDPAVCRSAATALGALGAAAGSALEPLRALVRSGDDSLTWLCRNSLRQIETALRAAPAELQAASAPEGTGTEPISAD